MTLFRFQGCDGNDVSPQDWLKTWAARYPSKSYPGYEALITKHKSLSALDIIQIGKWKDGVLTDSKWKANVAMVAYPIWMQAASELPTCPDENSVAGFLQDWSQRKYTDTYGDLSSEKRFGLSRATALLHFLSGGEFPIFDSRVRRALGRLQDEPVQNTVQRYLGRYHPLLKEIAAACDTGDFRMLDKALFSYGDSKLPFQEESRSPGLTPRFERN